MQPASDHRDSSNPALRRWGPLAAIVAVVAIIGVVILVTAGGDGDGDADGGGNGADGGETAEGAAGGEAAGTTEPPDGAISWTRAQEEGLDVQFPDTCDPETGRVALPYFARPECYADAEPITSPDVQGVTDDTIKVVVYLRAPDDPIYAFVTQPLQVDDTNEDVIATTEGFVEILNEHMQTYGRQVELEFLVSSSNITDEVAARADAVRAMTEMGAFAVWGGPELANAWTEEIQARGGICIACPAIGDPDPNVYGIAPSAAQNRAAIIDYVSTKLAGRPAEFAGDPGMHDTERVFGHLLVDTGSVESRENADLMIEGMEAEGVEIVEQVGYELDPGAMQEQAGSIIDRFKSAGVTSIIYAPDPIGPLTFTAEATRQDYFPEWVLAPGLLADTAAFGRTFDQEQWQHAFGISALPARVPPDLANAHVLWDWYFGGLPPADQTSQLLLPNPSLFFTGVQAAGPNLTPETFRDGLFSLQPLDRAVTQPWVTYGDRGIWDDWTDQNVLIPDHHGIDDWVEIWWDAEAEGPDEIFNEDVGMYRYVNNGRRYMPGEFTEELEVFDPDAAVTLIEDIPEEEQAPDYPSPRG
jgi:hypothetical protein